MAEINKRFDIHVMNKKYKTHEKYIQANALYQ